MYNGASPMYVCMSASLIEWPQEAGNHSHVIHDSLSHIYILKIREPDYKIQAYIMGINPKLSLDRK